MEITSLDNLKKEREVSLSSNGIRVCVPKSWIVKGEKKLSYTSLIRIVECCRELHWNQDVIPYLANTKIDSTMKSFKAEFFKPIFVGSEIHIKYEIKEVRNRGYQIGFRTLNAINGELYSTVNMILVFVNVVSGKPITIPTDIATHLRGMQT